MLLSFTKMHGLGNDFMVLDLISHPVTLSIAQIRKLADRHFGVGFDQLLTVEPPSEPDVDFDYRIFNADGNEVEHCGNGARCFARFVLDKGLAVRTPIRVKTLGGVIELQPEADGSVTVDMGSPSFEPDSLPFRPAETKNETGTGNQPDTYQLEINTRSGKQLLSFRALSVGNPHIVVETDDVARVPVEEIGAALGRNQAFPKGVNVGFMQILDRRSLRLRVFERGVGETTACGTGACAAVVAGIKAGLLDEKVTAKLTGGDLEISWAGANHSILMRGPASAVFEGSITL